MDLSSLSDAQLQALYGAPPDVSKMSDAELLKAYHGPSYGEDAAKSTASGLANMTAGTLGMVGDIRSGLSSATDAIGNKLGVAPDKVQAFKDLMARTPTGALTQYAPTSAQIKASADPIVSPDYEPQHALGHVLKTGAEFLPGMADPALAGPAALKTAAKLFATRVAAPALTTEAAGALTKGTEAEPYARVAGALVGGAGASKIANSMSEARAIKAATPALADVKAEASNTYDALTSRNVATPIQQSTLDNLAGDITTTLNNKGIRPSNAESIHSAVNEIKSPATAGAADVADLVAARESIKELLGKPDTSKAGAFVALKKIEATIEQHSPGTMAEIREADKNWGAYKASAALDKKIASAELRAAAVDSGSNVGNKIRQNAASLLEGPQSKFFSAETRAELEKIVRGTATQQVIRKIDRLLGGGGGLGMLAGGAATGYATGGWEGGLAGAAGAHGMRMAYNRSVLSQAQRSGEAIRRSSPLGKQTPLSLPAPIDPLLSASLPALLAANQSRR